ncbi:LysR family transcriptional regulator [Pluralibacter gergoviae]
MKSFTRAAEFLNITQPTISQQIKRLEDILNVSLFFRDNKKITLTSDGELLLSHAKEMLALNDKVSRLFKKETIVDTFVLGVPEHFCEVALPKIISRIAEEFPFLQIVVKVTRSALLLEAVNQGKIDVCIVIDESNSMLDDVWNSLSIRWFISDGVKINNDYVPLALFKAPCEFRSLAIKKLEENNIKWRCSYESEDLVSLKTAVKAGIGVTVLPFVSDVDGVNSYDEFDFFPKLPVFSVGIKQRKEWNPIYKNKIIDVIRNSWSNQY